jgi:hypothetical protein
VQKKEKEKEGWYFVVSFFDGFFFLLTFFTS